MPSLIGSLFVSLTADFAPFQRNMKSAEGVVSSTSASMRRNIGLTERSLSSFQRTTSTGLRPTALIAAARTFDTVQQRANLLRGALFATTAAFGGLGAALTTNVVSRYLDSFTGLENQMRVVSKGSVDLAANMGAVQDIAERSRSSLAAVATLFSRLQKASPASAVADTLRRVETINKALQLGGASAQEAASAAIQFSQAIASNRLGGEELRAILETPLGMELAKGLGVTIGEFRKMGTAGELTSDVLFKALDKISSKIDGDFAKSVSTIDQALTVADGKITAYAGSLDDAYGITKLMTGAIGGFADNLETLVPLLAGLGIGLGSIFGGRLVGGAVGGRVSAVVAGISAIAEARKEDLRLAKEQETLARRNVSRANSGVTAARAVVGGDTSGLADRKTTKQYERDLAALTKTSREYVSNLNAQAAAEFRVNSITGASAKDVERKANAQAKLNTLKAQEVNLSNRMATQRATVDQSRSAMDASGVRVAASGLQEAERAAVAAEGGFIRANAALVATQRSAGLLSTSFGVLKSGAMSLVGFLGGPWGVAFTGAIALATLLGIRARESAEKIAAAQAIINDELQKAGQSLGGEDTPINIQQALLEKQIKVEADRLKAVTEEYARQRGELADQVTKLAMEAYAQGREGIAKGISEDQFAMIGYLTDSFRDGKLSIDDFNKSLGKIGFSAEDIDRITMDMKAAKAEVDLARFAIDKISEALDKLNLRKTRIDIEILVDDPYGVLTGKTDPARIAEANQRKLYGAGQAAARIATEEARKRKQILDAAADTGDRALNSPAKINEREQELLEQGYVRTREAARALATEELNIAEANRLAAKSANSAAKEHENFASKLAELEQQGDASFLSDLDRQVVAFAKSLKDGSGMMAQYIEAINSGDMSLAPAELLKARDALMQIGAAETWRNIIDKYGEGAQLASQFADKQAELNFLVANGKITAGQAGQAWADFLGGFQEYAWIDQTADAFADFASAVITDFDNIEDAFKNLLKALANMLLQEFVLNPLKEWIRGSLANAIGGGATGNASAPGIASAAASVFSAPVTQAAQTFTSAGVTKGGIPLSEVSTQGLTAKVNSQYAARFQGLFNDLEAAGYPITSLGEGGYSYRKVAGTNSWSKHSTGDAVDINPRENPYSYSRANNFDDYGINPSALAKKNGLTWGGDWRKSDAMHFQVDKNVESLGALDKTTITANDALKGFGGGLGGLAQALSSLGGGANGAGGWFSNLSGMFGGAMGATSFMNSISPLATAFIAGGGVGLFAGGGYTGPGSRGQVAGLVHAGEVVWNQDDVRRHGGAAVVDAMRRGMGGYAGGGVVGAAGRLAANSNGMHVTIGWDQDGSGNIAPIIRSVSRETAEPIAKQEARKTTANYDRMMVKSRFGSMQDQYNKLKAS